MILLDTNVVSALMRREPEPRVVAWLDEQPAESVWTTSVTVFEVRLGLEIMATGRRRRQLEEAFTKVLDQDLEGRVVAFDRVAAWEAGRIAAQRRRAGRSIEIRDLQIAGIAVARRATIATGHLRHFAGLGPRLVDPCAEPGRPG